MIITRTPLRISFFGGGTDYPIYYREHGGKVLSAAISKYNYITLRELPPFFDHKYRIRYFKSEYRNSIEEIEHPSVRECLKYFNFDCGMEIVHAGDVPARSGLGSSSAFTVGLLHALHALKGNFITKRKIAFEAIDIEQNKIGESVGSQDQVAASFGGFNLIEFFKDDRIVVSPVTISPERMKDLERSIIIFFTGISRTASVVAEKQILESKNKTAELHSLKDMVDEAISLIYSKDKDLDDFGVLLNESWKIKRSLTNEISNDRIDSIYQRGLQTGAIGGKLLGAGGGGFIAFYAHPDIQPAIKSELSELIHVPFHFDQIGSHIIHNSL